MAHEMYEIINDLLSMISNLKYWIGMWKCYYTLYLLNLFLPIFADLKYMIRMLKCNKICHFKIKKLYCCEITNAFWCKVLYTHVKMHSNYTYFAL